MEKVNIILLDIRNLSIITSYNRYQNQVLDDISFTMHRGEIVGILGESGCGKSVTALSIMKLLPKALNVVKGEVLFEGRDLLKLSEKELQNVRGKGISMIFQEPMTSLNPVLKCGYQVYECIIQGRKVPKKKAKEKVFELFNEVKLTDPVRIYNSYPHQLSGGQRQRVMIAIALSGNPKILIADEPATALDVTVQKAIMDLLKELQKKFNISILFITHDIALLSEIADRILVMRNGRIIERGVKNDIVKQPQHLYTQGLFACCPPIDYKPYRLLTMSDFEGNQCQISNWNNRRQDSAAGGASGKEILIRIEDLKVDFLRSSIFNRKQSCITAVNQVSFTLYRGETLGLVGESGSGKTTIGRAIMQLIERYQGNIYYQNIKLNELNRYEKRILNKKIQLIFQDPYSSLNPKIQIGRAIMEPMEVHNLWKGGKQRKEKAMELLDKVGLEEGHFCRFPHQFSGGQRQRIVIARALALEPEVLICDESVSALDVSIQAQVLNLLNDLKEEFGLTYIFISHDLGVVKYMSDRIIVLNQGRVEETNTTDNLFHFPQQEYTKRLIGTISKSQNSHPYYTNR